MSLIDTNPSLFDCIIPPVWSPGVEVICYPAVTVPSPLAVAPQIEVQWAPDSGGVPGTYTTFAIIDPVRAEMYATLFTDADDNYYWFRCRHIGPGYAPSAWSNEVKAKPIEAVNSQRIINPKRPIGDKEIVASAAIQPGTITSSLFATGLTPVEIVTSLPATGNYEGRVVYLTTDDKLYRHTGSPTDASGFTKAVDGLDLVANSVTTNAILAGAVTAAKIAVTQLDAITANMGTLTAGLIRDPASKVTFDLSSRLITMIDEQGSPITRVQIGEVGGSANGWGIELKDELGAIVFKTWGARNNTLLNLYSIAGGQVKILDENAANLVFIRNTPSVGIATAMSSTYGNLEIQNYSDSVGTITSTINIGSSGFSITLPSNQNFTVGLAGTTGALTVTGGQTVLGDGMWPMTTIGKSNQRVGIINDADHGTLIVANMQSGVASSRGGFIYLGARGTNATSDLAYVELRGSRQNSTSGNFLSEFIVKVTNAGGTAVTIATLQPDNPSLIVGTDPGQPFAATIRTTGACFYSYQSSGMHTIRGESANNHSWIYLFANKASGTTEYARLYLDAQNGTYAGQVTVYGSGMEVGTSTAHTLLLYTNGVGRLSINSSGHVNISQTLGVLSGQNDSVAIRISGTIPGTSTSAAGVFAGITFNSSQTVFGAGFQTTVQTAASAFTINDLVGVYVGSAVKGSGSSITNLYGMYVKTQGQGSTSNIGLYLEDPTGSGAITIYAQSGANLDVSGNWNNASSRTIKRGIVALTRDEARASLKELEPVRFERKRQRGFTEWGFIAEDVPAPLAARDGRSMNALPITAALVAGWQDHEEQITHLQRRVKELETKVAALEAA